jgi:hypothetical protein
MTDEQAAKANELWDQVCLEIVRAFGGEDEDA